MKCPLSHESNSKVDLQELNTSGTSVTTFLLLIVLVIACFATDCMAQKKNEGWRSFFHQEDQFSVRFPPELKPIVPEHSPARLILIPKTGKTPSVNVLTFAGKYPLHSSLSSLEQRLTGEYQQAGLQDTYVQKIEKRNRIDGIHHLFAQLVFSKKGSKQLSTVSIFTSEVKHFVVTCILPLDSDDEAQQICDTIVTSLRSPMLKIQSPKEVMTNPPFSVFYYALGAILLLVLLIGYRNNASKQ